MPTYLLAHDLGTSGNKATLFTSEGKLVKSTVYSYDLHVHYGTWIDQNADDWWKAVCETTKALLADINPADVAAVSFSGTMMACLCVDKEGNALYPGLIWADMRSTKEADELAQRISPIYFYHITGHRLSSSYTGTKFMWIKKNEPEIYKKTYKTLNVKDYILLKLTGNFVIDYSDASSTCLMDITKREWSEELVDLCGLDMEKMPTMLSSVEMAGKVTREAAALTGLLEGTPIICGGGDGACAAVGTGAVRPGVANCCMGTSSWISFASETPLFDNETMATFNFAHIVPGYTLPCGTMQCGSGSMSWAVRELFKDSPMSKNDIYRTVNQEVETIPAGSEGLLYLPYLMGERSPRWNDKARGTFIGLTMNHSRAHILRSVMEGVALNLNVILETYRKNGATINSLITVGGGARNKAWLKILSEVMNIDIRLPDILEEATSMGAAITAGVGVGLYDDFNVIDRFLSITDEIKPSGENYEVYSRAKELFDDAYYTLAPFFEKM